MNFFGALGQLARVLPGYVEGERQAYQDNWRDLNEFNRVQQGQIGNAYLESVFPLEYQQAFNSTVDSELRNYANAANTTKLMQALPYEIALQQMQGQYAPTMLQNQIINQLDPTYRMNQTLAYLNQFGITLPMLFGLNQPAAQTQVQAQPVTEPVTESAPVQVPVQNQPPDDWNQKAKQRAGLNP